MRLQPIILSAFHILRIGFVELDRGAPDDVFAFTKQRHLIKQAQ